MDKSQRRRQQNFDPFYDEECTVESLIKELNNNSKRRGTLVARQLVQDMNEVDRAAQPDRFRACHPVELLFHFDPVLRKLGIDPSVAERMSENMTRIRNAFDGFAVFALPLFPGKSSWTFWRLKEVTSPRNHLPWSTLASIYLLAAAGRLRQVRECQICGRWFKAYRPNETYRFCKVACRNKYWQSTPEGKATKSAYMKRWRRDEREKEERALRLVRKK